MNYVECDQCKAKLPRPYFELRLITDYDQDKEAFEVHFCADKSEVGYTSACLRDWWLERGKKMIKKLEGDIER